MKSMVIAVLMLSMLLILLSCRYESQPTQNTLDIETQSLSKKGGKPNPELIIFEEGDLEGNQTVFGCCPNRGPFPEYTMTLSSAFEEISGTYDGHIFTNFHRSPGDYPVKFWWGEVPNDYFLEIRGGEANNDKRNKILTVTFVDVPCEVWINDKLTEPVDVSFTLTRARIHW